MEKEIWVKEKRFGTPPQIFAVGQSVDAPELHYHLEIGLDYKRTLPAEFRIIKSKPSEADRVVGQIWVREQRSLFASWGGPVRYHVGFDWVEYHTDFTLLSQAEEEDAEGRLHACTEIEIRTTNDQQAHVERVWLAWAAKLDAAGYPIIEPSAPSVKCREGSGVSEEREKRFEVEDRLKTAHLNWTYEKVAIEASIELGVVITGEDVRYDYRTIGKKKGIKWQRGDVSR